MSARADSSFIYVTSERSGDLTIIDGTTEAVVGTYPVGKRPRGIRISPDGKRVYAVVTGSPRMAPGVDTERAPADKAADACPSDEKTQRVN